MRVVHVTPYYAPAYTFGGVVRAVEGLASAQARAGHTVHVVTTDALAPGVRLRLADPASTLDGVDVQRARALWPRGALNLSLAPALPALLHGALAGADVCHIHEFRTSEALTALVAAGRAGVPVVLSPHGTLPHTTGSRVLKRTWDALLGRRAAAHVTALHALAAAEDADARTLWQTWGHPHPPTRVIPNGVDEAVFALSPQDGASFRARWGLGGAPVVLYLGRLHPRKGADVLARAFTQLPHPHARLVLAGPDDGLRAAVEPLAASDPRIVLTGYLDEHARLRALAAADVFVLPAVGEGLPLAALEALAAGVPSLLSAECHLPEAIAAGAAREISPDDPSALAQALAALLDAAPEATRAMRHAAATLAARAFRWDSVAADMTALYDNARAAYSPRSAKPGRAP